MGRSVLCPWPDLSPIPCREPHPSTLIADSTWDAIWGGLTQGPNAALRVPECHCALSQACPEGRQHAHSTLPTPPRPVMVEQGGVPAWPLPGESIRSANPRCRPVESQAWVMGMRQ